MISLWQHDSAIIGRVRIRARPSDPLAAQQRVANLLKGAVIRQSLLPPSAILCVRSLRDPLPRTRWLDGARGHLPPEWEQAATRELDRLAAGAARPGLAPVPPSAEAVAFLDRADLLACLTEDWLAGKLRANWWWLALLPSGDLDLGLMREWERSSEFMPAVIETLQWHSRVVDFLRRIPESWAARLLTGILQTHGLLNARAPAPVSEVGGWSEMRVNEKEVSPPPQSPTGSIAEPWLPWVPEASAPNINPTARLLLAYALLLRRAPAVARASWFASRVSEWRSRSTPAAQTQGDSAIPQQAHPPLAISAAPDPASPKSVLDIPWPLAADEGRAQQLAATPDVIPHAAEHSSTYASADGEVTPAICGSAPEPSIPAAAITPGTVEHVPRTGTSAPPIREFPATAVETAFGGAFFLLNVALHLNLYGDFANPCHPGLELSIWDFVALLAVELTGGDLREDPIWPTLAELAGRSALQKPGEDFPAPDAWRTPLEWLHEFPEVQPWRANSGSGRLRLTHPAGFCAVDVPVAGRTAPNALAAEMQPYSAEASPIEKDDAIGAPTPLDRWTGWIAGYLRARLVRALNRDDAAQLLCRIPARLQVTSAHVHVFIRLEEHSIEIRLAGLDRDPGWIPAAGRYVSFHFD